MHRTFINKSYSTILSATKLAGINAKTIRSASFSKPVELHKRNWKENVVYLYQFKRTPVIPNLSPFCLKVETFLRAYNIKYEAMPTWTIRSKEGKLPFIELNGKQIADSQFIFFYLMKNFKIDEGLSAEQAAIARSVDRMIEGSTHHALTYFRNVENAHNVLNPNISGLPLPSFVINLFLLKRFKTTVLNRLKSEGTARHPRDAIIEILRRDIQALDGILGDKKFFMGIVPTTPDFTAFGHLATAYYLPFQQPITSLVDEEFPRIQNFLERMRTHYWVAQKSGFFDILRPENF
uniref:Glutathione S-transferase n=1 Tax=Acrobeloides nanus TaxID=290746 RepID=A0A914C3A8_9BILA